MIEKIVENIKEYTSEELAQFHLEKVYLENEALAKRIHHVTSDHNREISIRLPKGKHLHVGDILIKEEKNLVIIEVLSEDVLVISPKTIKEMGEIAHELGNRHLPAQFFEAEMIVQYDYLVENLLKSKALSYERKQLKLDEAFRHIGHSHNE